MSVPQPPNNRRILVVDDESDVTELLTFKLRREGYVVEAIENPLEIMGKAREFSPDLFILDIMMPELDGLKVCRMIRADRWLKSIPVIFLSAKGQIEDRIKGLELGADDYIAKPFEIKELLLRVSSIFKRMQPEAPVEPDRLEVNGIMLDASRYTVSVDGQPVELTATEFKLLRLLMERKNRVQSRENLLVNVWNYETNTETRTIDTHIRRLREKLGEKALLIETIRGVGYRMNEA